MARGNGIIVSAEHGGRFEEGIISGTPKPGTLMMITNAAEVGGRNTWAAFDGSTGKAFAILLHDTLQGRLATTAYAAGDRAFLYYPRLGEEFNLLYDDVTGTGDDIAVGNVFLTTSAGLLLADSGTGTGPKFEALEAVVDPTADQLVHVRYSGIV